MTSVESYRPPSTESPVAVLQSQNRTSARVSWPTPETIHNWRRLDDRITTSGQPTEPQLAGIRALGIRHIVNLGLHTHEKALPDEAASVSRLGMTYIHIPVDFQNPTDEDFAKFCVEMARLEEVPVHVHCIANYRVSAFFYRYRRDVLGMDEVQARADMEQIWHPEGVEARGFLSEPTKRMEADRVARIRQFLKAELKRHNVTYEELARRLTEIGDQETKASVANKLSRGQFSAIFFVDALRGQRT